MRFPKPLVYLGFILMAIAVLGSVYEALFKDEPEKTETQASMKEKAAGLIVDKLFEQTKSELGKEGVEIKDEVFAELKKHHKTVYVNKYVFIAEELDRKKHTDEESQKINDEFNANTVTSLKAIYKRKLSSSNSK